MLNSDVIGCFDCIDGDNHIGIVYTSIREDYKFKMVSSKAYGTSNAKFNCVGINYDSATN